MNSAIEVRGLCKDYGAFGLKDVSFSVPQGYIMGFVGPNGAGKTTTIRLILKIIRADSGTVKVLGRQGDEMDVSGIGVVTDAPMYVDDWTADDVGRALKPFYRSWDSAVYARTLREFGLDGGKKVRELSRGMKTRLQIAAALAHSPRLLILDEPTSGLDPAARDEICDLLRSFVERDGNSVFYSTHITSDLEKTADYITFLLGGRVVYTGAKDELLEKYVRVSGGPGELDSEQKRRIIGYREYPHGFEGMAETAGLGKLPRSLLAEAVSLDEIIIFMNKGAKLHE